MMRPLLALTLLSVLASAAAADDYLYRPEPATGAAPTSPNEGILVRTITIRRGDTLSALSQQYGGRGSYYPQILLFNRIANPNLIYAGDTLRVPLSAPLPQERRTAVVSPGKPAATAVSGAHYGARQDSPGPSTAERRLFDRGIREFRKGRYRTALTVFDHFLTAYPDSPRAADATFYRGECYLNLSRQ